MAKNPEGHSPRYWRTHPKAVVHSTFAEKRANAMTESKMKPESLWAHRALVLACLTIAMAAALVIIEKTPLGMVVLLLVFLVGTTYPVMFLAGWFDPAHRKTRVLRFLLPMLVLLVLTGWMGYAFWPKPKIRIVEIVPEPITANVPLSVALTYRND